MRFNKKILFSCLFLLILIVPVSVSAATGSKQMDLSKWSNVELNYLDHVNFAPNWVYNDTKTAVTQTTQAMPSILLSDVQCINDRVHITML